MATLKDQMLADVDDVFLNTDEFADDAVTIQPVEGVAFTWTAVVGELQPRLILTNNGRSQEWREAVQISGATSLLPTVPLPDQTPVTITRFGDVPFQVYPDECHYGR